MAKREDEITLEEYVYARLGESTVGDDLTLVAKTFLGENPDNQRYRNVINERVRRVMTVLDESMKREGGKIFRK